MGDDNSKSDSLGSLQHYYRFLTKWRAKKQLQNEPLTIILSPHMDDLYFSLSSTILSGKLGKNILGINVFTATDSLVKTNSKTDFSTITRSSTIRINEEVGFSGYLMKQGINYLPIFLGLKDAAVDLYYQFILSRGIERLPDALNLKNTASTIYYDYIPKAVKQIRLVELLQITLSQFEGTNRLLMPIGIGDHLDHLMLRYAAEQVSKGFESGMYADIPYLHDYGFDSLEKIRQKVPKSFNEVYTNRFDAQKKSELFRKLFESQYEKGIEKVLSKISRDTGEVIFWRD